MRRFQALLMAGLAAAPVSAVAGPSDSHSRSSSIVAEPMRASADAPGQGRLGLLVMALTPELRKHLGATEDRGVLVGRVEPLSPARAAGISVGDVLVAVRGHKVTGGPDVALALSGVGKDQEVAVELVRNGKPITVRAKLAASAASTAPRSDGGIPWLRDWTKLFEDASRPQQMSWLHTLQEWLQAPQSRTTQI